MSFVKPKSKTRKKTIAAGVTVGIVLVGSLFFALKNRQINTTNENKEHISTNATVEEEIKDRNILMLNRESLSSGTLADPKDFTIKMAEIEVPLDAVESIEELEGKRVRTDLIQNQILRRNDLVNKNAWFEEGDRYVEVTFQDGALPINIPEEKLPGTLVDIVLFEKGIEDKVVISKTAIIALNGNRVGFNLNKQEREYLREAITDGVLYLDSYLDNDQKESEVTYIPYTTGKIE